MISFTSDNLDQEIYKNDDIDISLHMTGEKLDHIFKEYLYFTTTEKLGTKGWIVVNYELRTDKFEELFNDDTLGSVLIYWLSVHYIQDILNSSEIKLVTNVNRPDKVQLFFNQKINESSFAVISNIVKASEYITEHSFGVRNINFNTHKIEDCDSEFMVSHTTSEHRKMFNNSLVIVNENFITDIDVERAIDNLFANSIHDIVLPNSVKKANKFAFKLTIYGSDYYVLFSTNYNNYIIGNRLKEAFKLMDTKINSAIQEQKEVSFLHRFDNESFPLESQYFVEDFDDPDFVTGELHINNSYLSDWCKVNYCSNNLEFNLEQTFTTAKMTINRNIFHYIDEIGKGIVYFDFDSSMMNAVIGDLDDYNFLSIYGYDDVNKRPIVLGIAKDYESAGSMYRPIKMISGGITAINNDELDNDITSSEYEYLLQTTLVDVDHIHFMDTIGMVTSVYGLTEKYPKQFTLFNELESDRKFFYNDSEFDAKAQTINAQVYKQTAFVADSTAEQPKKQVFTIKSLVLDLLSNYGYNPTGIGYFKFFLDSTEVTPSKAEITVVPHEYNNYYEYDGYLATALSTEGAENNSQMITPYGLGRRRIANFDNPITFDRIEYVPYYNSSSTYRNRSVKAIKIYGCENHQSYPTAQYGDSYVTEEFQLVFDGILPQHNGVLGYTPVNLQIEMLWPDILPKYQMKSFVLDVHSNILGNSSTRIGGIRFYLDGQEVTPTDNEIIHYSITTDPNSTYTENSYVKYIIGYTGTGSYELSTSSEKIRMVAVFDHIVEFDTIKINQPSRTDLAKDISIYTTIFDQKGYKYDSGKELCTKIYDGELAPNATNRLVMIPPQSGAAIERTNMYTLLDTGSFGLDQTSALSMAIPYDAMLDLFNNVSTDIEMTVFLNKWFWTEEDTNVIDFDNVEYDNLFLKYVPILSGKSIYKISHQNSVVGFRTINAQLLSDLVFDVKMELLAELQNDTYNIVPCKLLPGNQVVSVINDDSEFDSSLGWQREIFTKDTNVIETHVVATSKKSEFLSMLINENIYHCDISRSSGAYICGLYRLKDVAATSYNKSVILNKVVGSDWYSYYSLKASGNDITFSGYFINSFTDNHYAWWMLDLDNDEIHSLSTNNFSFNCGGVNPIVTNLEVAENKALYVIDKSGHDNIQANWLNIFKIYDLLPQYEIVYAMKPFDIVRNQLFNIYSNDVVVVKEV